MMAKFLSKRFRPVLLAGVFFCGNWAISWATELKSPVISWVNGTLQDGEVARVDIRIPEEFAKPGQAIEVKGKTLGKSFDFFPSGSDSSGRQYSAIIGVTFGTPPGEKKVMITVRKIGAQAKRLVLESKLMVVSGQYPAETITVKPNHVSLSAEDARQLRQEKSELGKVYRSSPRKKLWTGPFQYPLNSELTSPFGTRRVYNGVMQSFHQGVDFRAAEGTPVLAAATGKIVLAKNLLLTGNTVIIDHGFSVFTIYAHLSQLSVQVGTMISGGQLLGLSGMTGRASGPHLHWGANVLGARVNPLQLTKVLP